MAVAPCVKLVMRADGYGYIYLERCLYTSSIFLSSQYSHLPLQLITIISKSIIVINLSPPTHKRIQNTLYKMAKGMSLGRKAPSNTSFNILTPNSYTIFSKQILI